MRNEDLFDILGLIVIPKIRVLVTVVMTALGRIVFAQKMIQSIMKVETQGRESRRGTGKMNLAILIRQEKLSIRKGVSDKEWVMSLMTCQDIRGRGSDQVFAGLILQIAF